MGTLHCDPNEIQQVKNELLIDAGNIGVGILHEPTDTIYLAPFDDVPGGHNDLVLRHNLNSSDCLGFAVGLDSNGMIAFTNVSHLNGKQGMPGSLQMPTAVFREIVDTLQSHGL